MIASRKPPFHSESYRDIFDKKSMAADTDRDGYLECIVKREGLGFAGEGYRSPLGRDSLTFVLSDWCNSLFAWQDVKGLGSGFYF